MVLSAANSVSRAGPRRARDGSEVTSVTARTCCAGTPRVSSKFHNLHDEPRKSPSEHDCWRQRNCQQDVIHDGGAMMNEADSTCRAKTRRISSKRRASSMQDSRQWTASNNSMHDEQWDANEDVEPEVTMRNEEQQGQQRRTSQKANSGCLDVPAVPELDHRVDSLLQKEEMEPRQSVAP